MNGRDGSLITAIIVIIVVAVILFVGYAGMNALVETSTIEKGDPFYNATSPYLDSWTDSLFLGFVVCAGVLGPILAYLYGIRNSR